MLKIESASLTINIGLHSFGLHSFCISQRKLYVGNHASATRTTGYFAAYRFAVRSRRHPFADLVSHGWVQASAAADEAAAKHARANKTAGKVSGVPAGTCFRCGDFVFVEADKAGSAYTHHEWRQKFKADEARQRGEDPKSDRNRGAGKNKIASMLENSLGKMEMHAKKSTEDEYLQDEAAKNKKKTLCAYCLDELSKDVGNKRFALGIQRARDRAVKA
jgi:hypothetical protein